MRLADKVFECLKIYIYTSLILLACMHACDSKSEELLSRQQIEFLIRQSAVRHGIDPELAVAIATVESKLNPEMVGGLGEIGLFQLRPEYHNVVQHDVYQNIETGVAYLAVLKRQCRKYGPAYFVCYNYGPSRELKHPTKFKYYTLVITEMNRRSVNLIARK
jgi:soluble lytic murein transglycosylase-like protein